MLNEVNVDIQTWVHNQNHLRPRHTTKSLKLEMDLLEDFGLLPHGNN